MTYKRLDKAIQLAAKWHAGEERDGENPLPYITHPMEVLVNLRYVGGVTDEDMLCAAALHDVLEESDATPEEIAAAVGARVRDLVQELTRREPTKKETAGLTKEEVWQLRADMLLTEIARMSHAAQAVKLADRLSNVREGKRTKLGQKLERYLAHTYLILETVPREVNPALWDAIQAELPAQTESLLG
jgi:(p)ppGpp synthase/HD superfamily hydrolase